MRTVYTLLKSRKIRWNFLGKAAQSNACARNEEYKKESET